MEENNFLKIGARIAVFDAKRMHANTIKNSRNLCVQSLASDSTLRTTIDRAKNLQPVIGLRRKSLL
jgi:hypothetical protein